MRRFFNDLKIMLLANLWLVPVIAGLIWALFHFVAPPPPMHATMATGSLGGGYHGFALKLRDELAKEGFTLELIPSQGSLDNLAKLNAQTVQLALIQSGQELTLDAHARESLTSLGVMYQEPIWLFTHASVDFTSIPALKDKRIAIGAANSGSGAVVRDLLNIYGVEPENIPQNWVSLGGNKAATALIHHEIDAAFFIGPAENTLIQTLAAHPELRLQGFTHTAAYQARLPFLNEVNIPEGMLNLANNTPSRDIKTIGPLATLVANETFHPSLTPLILAAASNVLKKGNMLDKAGDYPARAVSELATLKEAQYFYDNGLPILQRYVPFRIASLADRYIILAIPLLVLLFPIFKAVGPIYQWRIRARIYRWYKHLRETDRALLRGTLKDLPQEIENLKNLEGELGKIQVPLSYSNELYQLHMHVRYMIDRLEALAAESEQSPQ